LQLKPETSKLCSIGQSNVVTVYGIQRAFDYCQHVRLLSSGRSRADKDDLIFNMEARHYAFQTQRFSEPNIVIDGSCPNSREAGVIWTIGKWHARPQDYLLSTAKRPINSKFRIRFSIAWHTDVNRAWFQHF